MVQTVSDPVQNISIPFKKGTAVSCKSNDDGRGIICEYKESGKSYRISFADTESMKEFAKALLSCSESQDLADRGWITCKERLPNESGSYEVLTKDNRIGKAVWQTMDFAYDDDEQEAEDLCDQILGVISDKYGHRGRFSGQYTHRVIAWKPS